MKKSILIGSLAIVLVSCSVLVPKKSMDIPKEPTLWTVSQVDTIEKDYAQGFVFYKIAPVNPGGLNVRPIWIMDYSGAFQVGDVVNFSLFKEIDK